MRITPILKVEILTFRLCNATDLIVLIVSITSLFITIVKHY